MTNDDAIAQPLPGLTYRITYDYDNGKRREAEGTFVGIENDPVVINPDTGKNDKVSLHFILTKPQIRDQFHQTVYELDVPTGEDIHFHVWPEDLIELAYANHTAVPHTEDRTP